jgi:hypothetical protein
MPWRLRTRSTLSCGIKLHKSVNAQSTSPMISTLEVCVISAGFMFSTQKQPPQQFQRSFFAADRSEFTHTKPHKILGAWPIFALHHSHGGCPILAFFARVGGDAAGATLVRSTPPVVYAVVVPAPPPTLRFPERTGVALRSDLAHDSHQNSNLLFRLRQLRNNCGNFIECLAPAL